MTVDICKSKHQSIISQINILEFTKIQKKVHLISCTTTLKRLIDNTDAKLYSYNSEKITSSKITLHYSCTTRAVFIFVKKN